LIKKFRCRLLWQNLNLQRKKKNLLVKKLCKSRREVNDYLSKLIITHCQIQSGIYSDQQVKVWVTHGEEEICGNKTDWESNQEVYYAYQLVKIQSDHTLRVESSRKTTTHAELVANDFIVSYVLRPQFKSQKLLVLKFNRYTFFDSLFYYVHYIP